jgi:hypothetical protein
MYWPVATAATARAEVLVATAATPPMVTEASASTATSPQVAPGSDPQWKTTVAHTTNARAHAHSTAELKDSAPLLGGRRRRILHSRRRVCLAARTRQVADEVMSSGRSVHAAAIELTSWIPSCCARVAVLMVTVPTPAVLEASAGTATSPPPHVEQKDSAPLLEDRRRRMVALGDRCRRG